MYDTHKVKELPLLAKLAKDARFQQEAKLPTLETVQRETILAILLANADFRPYALTREKMASLLSGETAWQDNDGNSLTVQSSITLDALIALGVVSFYNNHCTLNLSSIPDEAHIDNKALVQTVTNLHHLFHNDEYLNPHFAIDIDKAKALLRQRGIVCELTQFTELNVVDNRYVIQLNSRERYDLLNDYLVAELFSGDAEDENDITFNMSHWLLIAQTFPERFIAQIDLGKLSDARRHRLLDDAVQAIENDRQLDVDVRTLTAAWWCKNSYSALNTDGTSMADRSTTGDFIACLERQTDEHTLSSLEYVLTAAKCGWFDLGFTALSRYFFLPEHIITGDIHVDGHSFISRGRTDKLFALAESRPELKYILLRGLIDKNPDYLYYLLRRRDTACLSLHYYKKLLISVLDGHHPEQSPEILIHLFTKVYEEFIHRYFAYPEDIQAERQEFALLLETFAVIHFPSTWQGKLTVEQKLLDIVIEKTETIHLSKIDALLFNFKKETKKTSLENKLYLLFKLLEKHQDHPCIESPANIIAIEKKIGQLVEDSLSPEALISREGLNASSFLEQLPWGRVSDAFFAQIKPLVGSWVKFSRGIDSKKITELDYINLRRSQLQIMLNLVNRKRDKNVICAIHEASINIMSRIAEDDERYLRYLLSGYLPSDYSVWRLFLSTLEQSTDEVFNNTIKLLREHFDLDYAFSLLHHTRSENRKSKVHNLIQQNYVSNPDVLSHAGLNEIGEAINYACMHNYMAYAGELIVRAKEIISKHTAGGHFAQQKKELWDAIEYKVKVLTICNEENLSIDDKIAKIDELSFQTISSAHWRECKNFYRNCLAHLWINREPERSYRIFDDLYRQTKSVFYAGNRFLAKYNHLILNEADDSEYRLALEEWESISNETHLSTMEDSFIHVWIACLIKLGEQVQLHKLWNQLLPQQKYVTEITECYVDYLKMQQQPLPALEILEEYSQYHGIEIDSNKRSALQNDIQTMLKDGSNRNLISRAAPTNVNETIGVAILIDHYRLIFSRPLLEIAKIIDPIHESVEGYLNFHIDLVIKELLRRKIQLNNRSDKDRKLVLEDDINRWFVSLFNHLVKYAGMSCHEQENSGVSPGGKNPGEIDFFFYERYTNQKLAIGEAFILTSADTHAINDHIDKIAGYDPEELDTVILIAWCSSPNFAKMAEKYRLNNQQREYKGFTSGDELKVIRPGSSLVVLKETRQRNDRPIALYHYLVNLTV